MCHWWCTSPKPAEQSLNAGQKIGTSFFQAACTIECSPDCNASCVFCAADRAFSTMSLPQAEGLLDDLSRGPIRNVVLGGGDPYFAGKRPPTKSPTDTAGFR
mgnify:CR=1 FL=1